MKFQAKSFQFAHKEQTIAEAKAACAKEGHPWADRKGKCVRCSAKIRDEHGRPD